GGSRRRIRGMPTGGSVQRRPKCRTGLGESISVVQRWRFGGDRDAQNNLGTMFLEGMGCQADKTQAVFWYRKSAEQGSADAQWNLGKRYLHGAGIGQDFVEAYDWFSKAAVQGCTEAFCEMGTMRRFGHGVEPNLLAAADFHLIAAEAGDAVACGNLSEYRAELEVIALSGSQMASLFLSRMFSRGFGVVASQSL